MVKEGVQHVPQVVTKDFVGFDDTVDYESIEYRKKYGYDTSLDFDTHFAPSPMVDTKP